MADPPPPSSVPQKRPLPTEDSQHRPRPKEKNIHREPREKKDSWRKKEALTGPPNAGNASAGGGAGANKNVGHSTPKGSAITGATDSPGLVRYRLPPPQVQDFYGHRAPPMAPVELPATPGEFFSVNDHPMNRRGFRYTPCEASHLLPALSYRGTEYEPFAARINFEDMNAQVYVNTEGTGIATPKGWRMARANVGVREGDWYFECKVLSGINGDDTSGGHVRVGWARREAPLDAPVGFDAYSYGLRDQSFNKLHMSRPKEFMPNLSFVAGDVIGLHISLPALSLQRELSGDPTVKTGDIIRDRLPIRFKNQLWFEHFEYQPTKEYEDLMNPATSSKPSTTPKTLPGSFIHAYCNGEYVGTPFEDLFSFLPPASKPLTIVGGRELDDGTLGYYPAVSVFKGGAVEVNFGPDWFAPPKNMDKSVRPLCERYEEQIAEDMVYDLVDEVDLLFTSADEGGLGIGGAKDVVADSGQKGEIKEMVMEDE